MSYATVAEARASGMQGTDAEIQAHLDSATVYLDAVYADRYKGTIASTTQPDLWPRTGAIDTRRGVEYTGIPAPLAKATLIASELLASGSVLLPSTVASSTSVSTQGRDIIEETVTDGEARVTTKWSAATSESSSGTSSVQQLTASGLPIIPSIEALMAALVSAPVSAGGSVTRFDRA